MMKAQGRVLNTQVTKENDKLKLLKTVEYEEELTIEQVHNALDTHIKNHAMYTRLLEDLEDQIAYYEQVLADYYGKKTGEK